MESCGGQDKLCMILYLTGNECFLVTIPIGDLTKSEKGGWVNGPALHPAATSLARYSMMTSGWSKADFQLPETMLVLSTSKPIFLLCSMLWSSLLHQAWSGWFARYLWKLLRCSGNWATKTTSGSSGVPTYSWNRCVLVCNGGTCICPVGCYYSLLSHCRTICPIVWVRWAWMDLI